MKKKEKRLLIGALLVGGAIYLFTRQPAQAPPKKPAPGVRPANTSAAQVAGCFHAAL
jgi:hypothetical protein